MWRAPTSRNRVEYQWLQFAGAVTPGQVPQVMAHDEQAGLFAMQYLPPQNHPVWKEQLLAGQVHPQDAAAVGDLVGRLHAASAADPTTRVTFATDDNFDALRIDPYFRVTARANPDLADRIQRLAATTANTHLAVVHGDVSPKNILLGPHGPVLLDAECGWFGDPAFDVAFCLNHLLLKTIVLPDRVAELHQSARALLDAHARHIDWEPADAFNERVAALLPLLALARIDGASPVEYLDPQQRQHVRTLAAEPAPRSRTPPSSTSCAPGCCHRRFVQRDGNKHQGANPMTFTLSTIRIDGAPIPVLTLEDGRIYRIADIAPQALAANPTGGLMTLFTDWAQTEPLLLAAVDDLPDASSVPPPATPEDWLTPLQYPNKVICTGANYYDHVRGDGGHTGFSKDDNIPVFFLKPPTTTLVGQGQSVRYPTQTEKFDYELELAFVIGKRGRHIPVENARDYIAGYTIALDLSARDWQRHPKHLVKFDLFGGKVFDDSCPLGPGIVPARFIDDTNLQLRFSLNGALRQNANTSDLIWPVPELVARISEHLTLEPGDIVLTGTPAGVGLSTGTWMHTGDQLHGEITGLGAIDVQIIDDPSAA